MLFPGSRCLGSDRSADHICNGTAAPVSLCRGACNISPLSATHVLQIINVFFLYHPPLGTARSDVLTYLCDHDGRMLSVLAGLLACFGDMAQFLAGQAVGYAVRPSPALIMRIEYAAPRPDVAKLGSPPVL